MITSMRIVKMYVWEGFFLSRLISHRKAEMWKQRMKLTFYGFCDSVMRSTRFVIFFGLSRKSIFSKYLLAVVLSIYFSNANLSEFKVSDLFAVSMFLRIIEENLRFMFSTAMLWSELINACERIQGVLELPEHSDSGVENPSFESIDYTIKNVSAKYPGADELALHDITTKIPEGELTGIIGSVGCGKSTLLSLLLNELDISKGTVPKFNSFGFASQEAWIISGTIK